MTRKELPHRREERRLFLRGQGIDPAPRVTAISQESPIRAAGFGSWSPASIASLNTPRIGAMTFLIRLRLFPPATRSAGLCLHEIPYEGLIYPKDGVVAGYFHRHPDPAVPVYWLADETILSLRRALALYEKSRNATCARTGPGTRRFGVFKSKQLRPGRRQASRFKKPRFTGN